MLGPPLEPNLASVLDQRARRLGDQPFLHAGAITLSWSEMEDLTARVAGGLLKRGHGAGARVLTAGGAASTQLATWFACQRLGAVWVPLNPLLSGDPLVQILRLAQADVVVGDTETLGRALGDGSVLRLEIETLAAGARHELGSAALAPSALAPSAIGDEPTDETSWAKLMFTSGTTGEPKGVVWSRRCESIWARAYATELLDVDEGEGIFTCLPLSHVTAQGTAIAAMQRGATLTMAPVFSPFSFWDEVKRSGARRFTAVGTILATLARKKPSSQDRDHNIERVVCAGAPIPQWREIEQRFGVLIMETWGQTETAGCYTMPSALPQRPGSIGRATNRFETRIGTDELLIRPTSHGAIFDGYLRGDGALESPYDTDGWYHTGDHVRVGTDGDFEFVVRIRESIRRRGEIIASAPIEEAAASHPSVAEAAAVPVISGMNDEEIKLCVVSDGPAIDPAELHRYLQERLPRFMVPRFIQHFDAFPKTPSTRIQKFKLGSGATGAWDARHRRSSQPR